jgi:hypothetical protein
MIKYWFIIHSIEAYNQHPDYIGQEAAKARKIKEVKKGDKIVYYATGDSVVVGTFDVIKAMEEWSDDEHWTGPHICMNIKLRKLAKHPYFVPINDLVENIEPPISIFPDKKFKPIRFKGRTAIEITEDDFKAIEEFIQSYKAEPLFQGLPNDGNLGKPMELGVLNYAPTSEQGVVALFVHFIDKLKDHKFVKIEFIRAGFPDACVIEKEGKVYNRKYIEFEFKASQFKQHVKNKNHKNIKCDYVVCWENDYYTCPIEVIELKSEISKIMGR